MYLLRLLLTVCLLCSTTAAYAEKITIAAAADLKFAMEELVTVFRQQHPGQRLEVVYGSSGRFFAQIRNNAPYDLFFSADIDYPRQLAQHGLAGSAVKLYGVGRLVLWSSGMDASRMTLASLTDARITRIAIANPRHAPYGKRAEEALRAAGLWERLQARLVFGENIAHTAQFVQSGNAQVGIIALSLAINPELAKKGGYYLIPATLHTPLEQGYIITQRGAGKPLAKQFADYIGSRPARQIMARYGFVLPGEVQ